MGPHPRRWLPLPLAATIVAATMGVAGTPGVQAAHRTAAPRPVYGGTLNMATQSPPHVLDPARGEDVVSGQFTYLMFNTLVTYAPTSTRIVPSLAARWTVSPDGRTYTFYLRHGVTFSNGNPFTAQDVVYTFTRLNQAATDCPYQGSFADIVGGQAVYAGKAKALSGIRAVGRYEVVMHLVSAEPYWLNVLALGPAAIVDPRVAASWNADLNSKTPAPIDPVGTGPFVLAPYSANSTQYVFERNPHYFVPGLPYLAKVIIHIGASPQLQLQQFQRGQLQAMSSFLEDTSLDGSQYLVVRQNAQLRKDYLLQPDNGTEYLFEDVNTPPFNNQDVREAIAYAINKPFLTKILTNGRGEVANSILPPAMPGYDATMNAFPVDYAAGMAKADATARALLKEAGYANGINIGQFDIIQGAGDTEWASLVVSELAAAGIKVQAKILSFPEYIDAVETGKAGFAMSFWTQDYPDPQDFMFNLFDGQQAGNNNFSRLNVPQVNRLIEKADVMANMTQRIPLYRQAELAVLRSAAAIPVYFLWQDGLVAPNVYPKTPQIWLHPVLPSQLDRVWIER